MKKATKQELSSIIDLLVDDVADLVKSEKEGVRRLSKADPGEETPGEKKPEGSSIEGTEDSGSEASAPATDDSAGAPPAPEASGDAAPPAPEASAEGSPTGDPAADASQGLTPETIKAEIEHLPVDQVKMYYLAFKARLMELLPQDGGDAAAAGAPPADPSAAGAPPSAPPAAPEAPPAPEGSAPPMGKGEFDDKSGKIAKSEESLVKAELTSLRGELTSLKKALDEKDATIKALEDGVGQVAKNLLAKMTKHQGMRKSLAGVSFQERPGTESKPENKVDVSKLSKSEITARLNKRTASPDLAKSDREKVSGFYAGTVKIAEIAHLLAD